LGYLPWVANAALDFYRRPDHVLQEKHLLRCPQVEYAPSPSCTRIGFLGFVNVINKMILGHILLALGGMELIE